MSATPEPEITDAPDVAVDAQYDVVICGGGLAGATLARQIKLEVPDTSVLILDKLTYPVPVAAFKVGESTVEIAGYYFAQVLQLRDHMAEHHLPKQGLRYFWNGQESDFARRPEIGLTGYTPCPSYQIDRGKLENALFDLNRAAGVTIAQQTSVDDIRLNPQGPHNVIYAGVDGQSRSVRAGWVIDAMGRRLFLQKKLGLHREVPEKFNAAWFRIRGRLDVEDFVPDESADWHARVPGRQRYHSTTHLMGQGYWIWLIPLGSGNTSVGIVTDDTFHDFDRFRDQSAALDWLQEHDPTMKAHLKGREFMDYISVANFNYSTTQVFSPDRWACVGEAAAFSDPFYSPGSNMIAFENSILSHLVKADKAGRLGNEDFAFFNEFVMSQNDWLDYNIHSAYAYFGEPLVMSMGYLWDAAVGWSFATPQMFNAIYLDKQAREPLREALDDFYRLALQVKKMLIDWGRLTKRSMTFEFIDYYNIPFINALYARNLKTGKDIATLCDDHRKTLLVLEEFAQVMFLMAVEDVFPDLRGRFGDTPWLNAWAIGLDPARWEADGLFHPAGRPRDLSPIHEQLRSLYQPSAPRDQDNCQPIEIEMEI